MESDLKKRMSDHLRVEDVDLRESKNVSSVTGSQYEGDGINVYVN